LVCGLELKHLADTKPEKRCGQKHSLQAKGPAALTGVSLDFSRPGKPTDNALIESFNGRLRAECLNENWFLSLEDAQAKIKMWWKDYNEVRPHSALGDITPHSFAAANSLARQAI